MVEDAGIAQARELLGSLREYVIELSRKLEVEEMRARQPVSRGSEHYQRRRVALRQDFYEAHRLIDGLHRRFPQTLDQSPVHASMASAY